MTISNRLLPVQVVPSHRLLSIYSANPRVNSIIRTLVALYGTKGIWRSVYDYVNGEGKDMSATEIFELYQAARYAGLETRG